MLVPKGIRAVAADVRAHKADDIEAATAILAGPVPASPAMLKAALAVHSGIQYAAAGMASLARALDDLAAAAEKEEAR